ncbi:MAG: class I SAM-dependent methyltransferase [Promethearchaeota archaeon]
MNFNDEYYFNVKRKRPEEEYERASDYFKGDNLMHYATSKSMMKIQQKMTIRALDLLDLRKDEALILDAGCGPGFAAMLLKEKGFKIVALDIIIEFLHYYEIKDLNPIASDMNFFPFKSNIFDGIISISAFQWILRNIYDKNMISKVRNLVKSLYSILKPHSKAVIQFYPKSNAIIDAMGKLISKNTNFDKSYIIDNPKNPKKRKIYLVLKK